jgi:hypothetical protein
VFNNIGGESLQITNNLNYQSNIYPYSNSNMNKKINDTDAVANSTTAVNKTINIENCSSKDLTDEAKELYNEGKITDEDYTMINIRAQFATIRINRDGSTTHLDDTNRNWISVFEQAAAFNNSEGVASQSQISEDERLENIIKGL